MLQRFKTAPWKKVFRVLGWFALVVTLIIGVPSAVAEYPTGGFAAIGKHLLLAGILSVALSLQGLLMFTFFWVMHDVPGDWQRTKKFFRDLPENWRRFCATMRSVASFLWNLPGVCIRGIVTACRWLASLPGKWRATSPADRRATILTAAIGSVLAVTCYFMWPVAVWMQFLIGPWVPSTTVFMITVVTDIFLSAFLLVILLQVFTGVAEFFLGLFQRRTKRNGRED